MIEILGLKGILFFIGVVIFFYTYKNSLDLIQWFEIQTLGTKDEVLKKLERLFIKVNPQKILYILLFLAFGPSTLIFGLFVWSGKLVAGILIFIMCFFLGWKLPIPVLNFLIERRIKQYELQMVDTLNLLSNGLRAGQSLAQSFGMIVSELPNPVSEEYNLMLQQNRLGVPLEEALISFYERIPTEDNQMFVSSINILKETGGNLSEVFDTITEVIRERLRLNQKIETFTAQAKLQGIVLFCIPFFMLIMFSFLDPTAINKMFSSVIGYIILFAWVTLNLIGGFFIFKITQIKV